MSFLLKLHLNGSLHIARGDTIRVTVKNQLTDNGTDIHWHGVRQLNTAIFDGTPGTSECPLAPGQQKDYIFRATQYGTSWYHSHFPAQYSDGVVGPIVIAGNITSSSTESRRD